MPEIKIKDIEFNSKKIEKIYNDVRDITKNIRDTISLIKNSNLFNYGVDAESEKNKVLDVLNDFEIKISNLNLEFSIKIDEKVKAYLYN